MTEEQTKIDKEPVVGFVREEAEDAATQPETTDSSVAEGSEGEARDPDVAEIEVVEGEIVDEGATPEEKEDELEALRQQLQEARAQADEYLDDLRRERAAFQNFKKRQLNERAELRQTAVASLLIQILPILDDFERALDAMPEDQSDEPWIKGIELIQRKLHSTLDSADAKPIDVKPGQPFDPFVHEAVSYEEHEDFQEGEIIAVVQNGYKIGERVLRPAMVRVAK